MASLLVSTPLYSSSSSSKTQVIKAAIHVPKLPKVPFSVQQLQTRNLVLEEQKGLTSTISRETDTTLVRRTNDVPYNKPGSSSKAKIEMYAILEAISDRVEMHKNIGEQRDNWNALLFNSINMITLTASTMAGLAATSGGAPGSPLLALKLSSCLLFSSSTVMSLIINKLQPSQLAEEQRNAVRLFKQLQSKIQSTLALGDPTQEDVRKAIEEVLALDKAYPLPLLGAMLEKFPKKYEPASWWPSNVNRSKQTSKKINKGQKNGWSEELEMELREAIQVVKRKDSEDYDRLGNLVLRINKILAISGPLLTGIAAAGSAFVGNGSWAGIVAVMAGAMATAINALEHGGQVGMVFEMYRYCGGFFQELESSIEAMLDEKDMERREDGEVFEMKVAMKLGRSLSQLRQLASKSAASRIEGVAIDEFASKLF